MVRFTQGRRCQIAMWPATWDEPRPPCCGKPATWSSDDVSRDGSTTWMCDEHQEEIARAVDDAAFEVAS